MIASVGLLAFAGFLYYALFLEPYQQGRATSAAYVPEIGQFLEELPLDGPVRYWVMDNGSRGAWGYVQGRTDPEAFASMAEQRQWQSVEAEPSMVRSFHRLGDAFPSLAVELARPDWASARLYQGRLEPLHKTEYLVTADGHVMVHAVFATSP